MNLLSNFKSGAPASQVPASWYNEVAKWINNLIGGMGIIVMKDMYPPQITLDVANLWGIIHRASSAKNPVPTTGISIDPDDLGALTYRNLSDWKAPDDMTGLDNTTPAGWERGKTAYKNGVAVDSTHPPVGCSITVCTHACMRTVSGTTKHELLFARMEFDENGLLVRVVPVPNWYTLM